MLLKVPRASKEQVIFRLLFFPSNNINTICNVARVLFIFTMPSLRVSLRVQYLRDFILKSFDQLMTAIHHWFLPSHSLHRNRVFSESPKDGWIHPSLWTFLCFFYFMKRAAMSKIKILNFFFPHFFFSAYFNNVLYTTIEERMREVT